MSEITSFVCPASWKITTLGQICKETGGSIQTGPFGSQLHASDYVEDGIPSVMPKNISIEKILDDDIARVSVEDVNRLSKHKLQMGDIVYSRRGDVEKCVLVSEKEDGWLCGTGCIKVRIGPVGDISAKYIHAFLSHPEVRRWISQHAVGATMPNLNTSILSSVPVYLPPKELQSFIANSWFGFNQKLLVNAGINNTLENIAQAIFKSWFVDFEPTKVKIAAREALLAENPAATPEKIATAEQQAAIQAIAGAGDIIPTEQLQTIADLFPNQMVDSELGEVPDGWFGKNIEEICSLASGKVETSSLTADTYISTENMVENRGGIRQASSLPTSKTVSEFKKGDILVSNIRPYFKKIWLASFDGGRSNDVLCFRTVSSATSEFLYCLLNRDEFFDFMMQTSKGAKMPRGDKQAIMAKTVVVPDSDLQKYFSKIVRSFFNVTIVSNKQNKSLIMLRDALLPKLLSGEISFEDKDID